ncbi:MAG: hypothetical protein KDB27_02450, partial [Planctomycetales bacterium]|nr:hypothetical protein [Planctomycetales bacterium]
DWNGDGDFNSTDFVFAFQFGNYVREAALATISIDEIFGLSEWESKEKNRLPTSLSESGAVTVHERGLI